MSVATGRAARGALRMTSGDRAAMALRLLFSITLIEVALWAPLPVGILFGIGALWYITAQVRKAASTARSLGMDWGGLTRNSWLLGATMALAVVILSAAYFSGSLHRIFGLRHQWIAVGVYVCWAFVQEFVLQCFCLQTLRALVSRASALLLSGVVFAVAHLPNPSLTMVAFFGGVVFTFIYLRKRNLYVVAVMHAILGLTLAVSAPDAWFHQLTVGRAFLHHAPTVTASISDER